jgi:hypothetical protein
MAEGRHDDGIAGEVLDDPFRDDGWQVPHGVAANALADAVGPDWPPDAVPIALWPVETLRRALTEAPGAQLARVVAETVDRATELDPDRLAELSDDALGDLVVACGRMQSWMAGVQARVVAERSARESHALAHNSLVGQVTGELVVTEPEAVDVAVRAESGARHPSVIAALVAGRIDVRRAQVLLRSAAQLTVAERTEAIERFLPQAPRHTWKWLQTRMLAFAKARHGAAETAKAEARRRCVQLDRAENDMGWLSAYLPAADAAAVWGVVDDMAHQLRHATGEDRTLGQLRADSLTGIITGRLLPADRFTVTETSTEPSTGPSAEPSTELAAETRENAADGDPNGYAEGGANSGSSGGTDGGNTPACTCGGRTPVREIVQPVRIVPTRPVVRVTIPASALLGLDQAPGHLDGYGPVPAETARVIATDATWQRLLTDPVTGILTDYSTTTYQPGKVLRAAVEARDGTCTFLWGCDLPASRCDLDHIQPFDHKDRNNHGGESRSRGGDDQRGQTNADNLHALCRKHHLLKTHAGWGIVRDPETAITTWTTPTGRVHTRPPTVLDTHIELDKVDPATSHDLSLRALTGQRLPRRYATTEAGTTPTSPTVPPDLSEPPF